tara:strand:+ start:934 stop:1719 length:786 start_codon:yes stop_codon:yes gene_type:complete
LTDLFSEIEQDLRREQANKLWEKYGVYLVGLAVGIVLVASAFVGWRAWNTSRAHDASAQYDLVVAAAATQKPEEAAAAFGALAADTTPAYAALAAVHQADALLKAGDKAGAIAALDKAGNDKSTPAMLRGMVQIKAGMLVVDTATYEEMNARLASLNEADNPWRNSARELLGLSAYKSKNYAEAQANFAAIIGDPTAQAGLRDRAHVMQALLAPHILAPVVVSPATVPAADAASESDDVKADAPAPTNEAPAQVAPDTKAE